MNFVTYVSQSHRCQRLRQGLYFAGACAASLDIRRRQLFWHSPSLKFVLMRARNLATKMKNDGGKIRQRSDIQVRREESLFDAMLSSAACSPRRPVPSGCGRLSVDG